MRTQSHAIVEYPIFSILAYVALAGALVIPIVFAAHQDPRPQVYVAGSLAPTMLIAQEPREQDPSKPGERKLVFADELHSAAVALHERLFAALDRGDEIEIASICRTAAAMEQGAKLCFVLPPSEDQAADAERGQESLERLNEIWPPLVAESDEDRDARRTRILRSEVLHASSRCSVAVLEIERPGAPETEDKLPEPERYFVTSVVVLDEPSRDATVATSTETAAIRSGVSPQSEETYRIAHLHVSRAR